jgi:hypothetical protein
MIYGGTMASSRIRTYHDAVVIITGGASGIGRALACESANRGAQVVIADLQALTGCRRSIRSCEIRVSVIWWFHQSAQRIWFIGTVP